MEASTERRAPDGPRIPLDVLVRLSHEDFDEAFDADGVDVSAGGLALRADYLPEVGDRLRCRFDCPPDGSEIEVDGEVVWAHDAGERCGEFGLRFTMLDDGVEQALGTLLAQVGPPRHERPTLRLHLESVATPIDAEIVARRPGSITVEQELPFLRLGMGVVVEGTGPAHGRLAAVGLRVEHGVPRLVLSVEDALASAAEASGEESSGATLDDAEEPAYAESGEAPSSPWQADAPSEPDATLQDYELPASMRAHDDAPARAASEALVAPSEEAAPSSHRFELADEGEGWQARVAPMLEKTRALASGAAARLRPTLQALWARTKALAALVLEKGGPGAKQLATRLHALGAALVAAVSSRLARGKKAKRRTTAAPVRVAAAPPRLRRQRAEEPAPAPRSTNRRVLALGALAALVVAALVYGLTRPSDAPAPAEPEAVTAPVSAPPAPALVEELPSEPLVEGDEGLAAPAEPAAAPADPGTAESQAGRLGEPSYPSMRETATRASGNQSFGAADVPGGRTTTLRMSQAVASLRGERQPDGFTLTIPGALSLDRAGPIAASNPSVEQAMVLNRGDHSILTVRFVAGRDPAYRVVARGEAIEVTIGR